MGERPGFGYCSEGAKPPPSPSSLTPSELPEPTAPADKGTATPDPEQPLPPPPPHRDPFQSTHPASPHHAPHSAPSLAGRRSAGTSGAAGPGAGSRAPPCGSVWRGGLGGGGPGQGLGDGSGVYLLVRRNILPPGKEGIEKLESAVQRESDMTRRWRHGGRCGSSGGAGSECTGRRLKPQRAEEGGGGEERGGEGREGPCGCRLPGGGAAGHQCLRPRPRPPCTPTLAGEGASSPAHLSPRLTCCFSGAGANPSGRQRSKKIEVSMGQQPQPASLLSPLEEQKLGGTGPSSASSLAPLAMR